MHLDSLQEWLGTDLATQYSHNVNTGKEKIGGRGGWWKIDIDTCFLVKGRKGFLDTFWPTRVDPKPNLFCKCYFYLFFLSSGYSVKHDNEELITLARVTVKFMPESLPSAFNTELFFIFIFILGFTWAKMSKLCQILCWYWMEGRCSWETKLRLPDLFWWRINFIFIVSPE